MHEPIFTEFNHVRVAEVWADPVGTIRCSTSQHFEFL